MQKVIEAFFALLRQCVQVVITLFEILFGINAKFSIGGKYNARMMPFFKRLFLYNRFRRGITLDGKRSISKKLSLEHVLISGGSGSGKTSGIIIPSILNCDDSFVATDVDSQLFHLTSGYLKKQGFKVVVLNLLDIARSGFYNPIAYCKTNSDLKKLSELLIANAYGGSNGDKFWSYGGQSVIYIALRILKKLEPQHHTLYELRRIIQRFSQLEGLIAQHASADVWGDYLGFSSQEEKIKSGHISSALQALDKLSDESVSFLTSKNTINFSDLYSQKTALFIIVPETKLSFYSFLLSIFYTQLFDFMMEQKSRKMIKVFLDEFGNLNFAGNSFSTLATTLRRYLVSLVVVIQDLSMVYNVYGQHQGNAIVNGSMASKIYLNGMSLDTAQTISRSIGKTSALVKRGDKKQVEDRELMTVQELIQLKDNEAIYLFRNKQPVKLSIRPFYKNRVLLARTKIKPVSLPVSEVKLPEPLSLTLDTPDYEEQ